MSSHKSSLSQTVFDRSVSQWALITVSYRKTCFALWGTEWALIRAPDCKKFVGQSEIQCLSIGVTMSSDKSLQTQHVCWSIRESMSSDKSSWSHEGFDWLGGGGSISSDMSSWSQEVWCSIRESMSSYKSSWSQEVFDRAGSQWALIRASDRKTRAALSLTEWAPIRAPDCKTFVGQSEI